jgi:hypothetical protein
MKEKPPDQELFDKSKASDALPLKDIPIPRKKAPNQSSEKYINHNEKQPNENEKQPNHELMKEKPPDQELFDKSKASAALPLKDIPIPRKKAPNQSSEKYINHNEKQPNEETIQSDKKLPNEDNNKQILPKEIQKQPNDKAVEKDVTNYSNKPPVPTSAPVANELPDPKKTSLIQSSGKTSISSDNSSSSSDNTGSIETSSSSSSSSVDSSSSSSGSSEDSESVPTQIVPNQSSGKSSYDNKKQPNVEVIKEKSQIVAPNQSSGKSSHVNKKQPNEDDQQQVNTARSTVQMIDKQKAPNQSSGETSKSNKKQPNDEGITAKSPNEETSNTATVINTITNDQSSLTENIPNQQPNKVKSNKTKSTKPVKLFFCKKFDHDTSTNLERMEDSRYCKTGNRFANATCQGCKGNRPFVFKKVNDEDVKPSPKTPIYCCQNWVEHCQYALCNKCFNDMFLLREGGRRK